MTRDGSHPFDPAGMTILNVDDNEAARYVKSHTLRSAGYRVVEAETGKEALRLAREAKPQLVLLDVRLPDQDGLEVCRSLKADPLTDRAMVLLVSARAVRREDRVAGLEQGADGYLVEPFEADELLATIKALLRLYRSEQRLELALRATNDVVWDWDILRDSQTWNQAGAERFGWTDVVEQPQAAAWRVEKVHPEDRERVSEDFHRALDDPASTHWQDEYRFLKKDGGYAFVFDRATIVRDESSRAVRMVGAMQDITDRKQAEAALRESEGRLAKELRVMQRLQALSTRLIRHDELHLLLQEILSASTDLIGTDKGNIQLLDPSSGRLRIVVHQGLGRRLVEHFAEHGWEATCDAAMRQVERVIVEDVATEPSVQGTLGLEIVLEDGIRAIQSTPLITRDGRFVGMLNNHFRVVHRPSESDLRLLDVLARQAADLIERAQAEVALRESEERYRYIFESAGVALFEEDWSAVQARLNRLRVDGMTDLRDYLDEHPEEVAAAIPLVKIVDVNEYALRLFKTASKETLLESLERIFTPDTTNVFKEEMIALWEGRDMQEWAAPLRTLEGDALWVLFSLVLPKTDLEWRRVLVSVTDVTAMRQAEQALRKSEQRLQRVLETDAVGVLFFDRTGTVVQANDVFLKMTGYRNERIQRRELTWRTMTPPEWVEASETQMAQVERTGRIGPYEKEYFNADGSRRWMLFAGRDLGDGTIAEYCVDITDRKRAEEALKEAQQRLRDWNVELEQAVNAKTAELLQSQDRLRALATELNLAEQRERQRIATELHDHLQQTLVLGKLKLGQGKRIVGAHDGYAKILHEIDEILSEALTYTRTLVAELSPPVLRQHGLPAGLKWLAEHMRRHEIAVTVTTPDDISIALPEDQTVLVFQSVRELLINASKHAGTGKAAVDVKQSDGRLIIVVRDDGAGFDLAAAAAAAAADSSNEGISSKFGLFSIRERMRALGGRFDIRSAPGKGTTATLILPLGGVADADATLRVKREALGVDAQDTELTNASPMTHDASRMTDHASRSSKIRVLLVDDHAMVRQGLRSLLDSYEDVDVIGEASDGEQAITAVATSRPAVVVMDLNMPRMNGIEATARIKAQYPDTIVIGLSVNANDETQVSMRKAGACLTLTKEAAVDRLYQAMREALRGEGRVVSEKG